MKQWNVDVYDTDGLEGCGNKAGLTPLFMKPKFGMEEFSVVHFAGPVKYGVTEVDKQKFLPKSMWGKEKIPADSPTIDSFTTKNRDKVPESLVKCPGWDTPT